MGEVVDIPAPIKLRCRSCGHEQDYARSIDPDLPAVVTAIDSLCPECTGGDFGTEVWLDADGNEVSQDIH